MNGNFADVGIKEDALSSRNMKKVGPVVPPKQKKKIPETPQSCQVKQICEPLYSKRLQSLESSQTSNISQLKDNAFDIDSVRCPVLQKKHQNYSNSNNLYHTDKTNKVTLDNPAILEQQLEALAYHKKQLEKKGLLLSKEKRVDLGRSPLQSIPKLSSTSLIKCDKKNSPQPNSFYANINSSTENWRDIRGSKFYSNLSAHGKKQTELGTLNHICDKNLTTSNIYSNTESITKPQKIEPPLILTAEPLLISMNDGFDNTSSPPSPVSSSYSELRRATDCCKKQPLTLLHNKTYSNIENYGKYDENCFSNYKNLIEVNNETYININPNSDYSRYSPILQGSSNYESIYEPIHPRPPSQLSSRSTYLMYPTYGDIEQQRDTTGFNSSTTEQKTHNDKEAEVEALTDLLVQTLDTGSDIDSYGICFNCNQPVLGENSGCTAMDHVYHISCFTCSQCHINLQGKPFYALEGKPYCEHDYLQTLEKCSVCMNPILERILRATGKPYHPQCFTCIVCGNSLDGIPFTVDATNQNYCIEDFHKKFAPRCCVCKEPIMPEAGEEETIRVVALDRSFHFECYKCEDCDLLLSSEAEGRGCYPLDDHVLCKSCNAKRVQMLTNKIITEL